MKPQNPYERAFSAYLQDRNILFLPTLERHRNFTTRDDVPSLKNLDFLIFGDSTPPPEWSECPFSVPEPVRNAPGTQSTEASKSVSWLVDVKGRLFPSGKKQPQFWRNWVTRDDLTSLTRWEVYFGPAFSGLFVFAFELVGDYSPVDASLLYQFNRKYYAFLGIPLAVYAENCRPLSERWGTVTLGNDGFRRLARPMEFWLNLMHGEGDGL